jgi:hypothetical protein
MAPFPQSSGAGTPIFSGKYVYTRVEVCGSNSAGMTSGTLTMDPTKGEATLTSYEITGGSKQKLVTLDGSTAYTNNSTTLNYGGNTYHVTYGKLGANNLVNNASYIGFTENKACGDVIWLTR